MDISVKTGIPYRVRIERGSLVKIGDYVRELGDFSNAALVTDDIVDSLYSGSVRSSLEKAGVTVCKHVIPHGESSKSVTMLQELYSFFSQNSITRSDLVIALGGGVVGDLAGFAAASWMRGVAYTQIPTTLLAAIDSSVGGKTAVNIPEGKNLVGAFWQPNLVLCDPDTLSTLPDDIFADGMAEAIKYGCIWDEDLLRLIESQDVRRHLDKIIARCVEIKAEVVAQDERDHGVRAILNFGHTMGHALEKYHHFELSHGKGVAIGMVLAAQAGEAAGITPAGLSERIASVLLKEGLPISDPAPIEALCELCLGDKKRLGQIMNFIFLKSLGQAIVMPIETGSIEKLFVAAIRGKC